MSSSSETTCRQSNSSQYEARTCTSPSTPMRPRTGSTGLFRKVERWASRSEKPSSPPASRSCATVSVRCGRSSIRNRGEALIRDGSEAEPRKREQAMYAVKVRLRIDPSRAAAAAAAFSKDILPRVLSAKGFVRGYWLDPVDGEGFGFVLFETEDQARGATPPASDWSAPGVTILGADVARVAVEVPQP